MVTLRLESINQRAPYKVRQLTGQPYDFFFVNDDGVRFDVNFAPNDAIILSGAYEISISNKDNRRSPLDIKLKRTVFAIIEEFFEQNNETMLYIAETGDEKQRLRNRLFVRWFNTYEHNERYLLRTADGTLEGQRNYMAILLRKDNPLIEVVLREFSETVELLFD